MKLEAIIFDLDGVICFTDHYHYLAWKALADEIGAKFDLTRERVRQIKEKAIRRLKGQKSKNLKVYLG